MLQNSQSRANHAVCHIVHVQQQLIEERSRMLYEFHRKQNDKKPGSVHATYIITGTKIPAVAEDSQNEDKDGDSVMQSSPPLPVPSSSAAIPEETETITMHTMMLVKEEHLERAKSLFSAVSCIHVYALAAKGLSQVQTLAECNRKVAVAQAGEDPLTSWKAYGTIQNSGVRRRTTRGPPAPIAAPAAKPTIKAAPVPKLATEKSTSRETPISASAQKTATDFPKAAATKTSKPAPSKASASSIFKSFAKTAPVTRKPAPALLKNDSQASATSVQDANMIGFSDDDDDADNASLPEELFATKDSQGESSGKSKKDREAELQAMMDQDDEEDAEDVAKKSDEDADAQMDDVESPPAAKTADEPVPEADEEEPKVVVSNGRRRGKRRVPKKRTVRDEEGYLGKSPSTASPGRIYTTMREEYFEADTGI
jgi:DNA polymerase delta subunit 3